MDIDVLNVNWWAFVLSGLFTAGEWRLIVKGVAYTFATTYFINVFRKAFVKDLIARPVEVNPYVIRAITLVAGMVAAWTVWEPSAISMDWWQAGLFMGPLSIAVFHILLGISSRAPVKTFAPWVYPLLKGEKDQRDRRARKYKDSGSREQ